MKLKQLLSILIIFLSLSSCDMFNPEKIYNSNMAAGLVHFKNKRYKRALRKFGAAANTKPDEAEAYFWIGAAADLIKEKPIEYSIGAYKKAVELDPTHIEAHFALSSIYMEMEKYDEAKKHLDAILSVKPNDYETLNSYGTFYAKQKNYDKAVEYFNKVLNIKPKYRQTLLNMGRIYCYQEKYKEAQKYFKLVKKYYKDIPVGFYWTAFTAEKLGNQEEAIQNWKKTIEIGIKKDMDYENLKKARNHLKKLYEKTK
ncbi:MAG: tetratricopeptide repeat protein [Elusimicrobiota bacterium]